MANNSGKGWLRTRRQTKGEVVYFCHNSIDPGTGDRSEKLHLLGLVSQFPDTTSRWKEVKKLGRTSFIDNPVPHLTFDCEVSSSYEAITCTPEQTLKILTQLEEPEFILTLVIAATGLSISEALGLQWADIEYQRNRIMVRRSWVEEVGNCKNKHRNAPVAMHSVLAGYLKHWQEESPYSAPTNWVFASTKLKGAKPRCGSIASQTYLYPAAVQAGIFDSVEERNENGRTVMRYVDLSGNPVKRWGWHNLRHSLATWLVSSGVDLKTVSSMLRHGNVQTTLGIYSHAVDSNKLAAQGQYLESLQLHQSLQ